MAKINYLRYSKNVKDWMIRNEAYWKQGIKKSEIIKYINKKYNGNYKNIVYNYGRY